MKLINTFITCHMLFKWGSSLATTSKTTLLTLSVRRSPPLTDKMFGNKFRVWVSCQMSF